MKKLKLFLFGLLAIIAFAAPISAQAATFALSPTTGTHNKGCTFQVRILLDSAGAQVDSAGATLLYDNGKIAPSQFPVQQGTLFPTYVPVTENQNGKVVISGISTPGSPFTGSGTFATVSFTVVETAAPGPFTIKFEFDPNDRGKTTDSNIVETGTIAELLTGVTDGSYNVGSGPGCSGNPVGGSESGSLNQGTLSPSGVSPGFSLPTYAIISAAALLIVAGLAGSFLL